ncbi:transcription factor, Myb superfamily [Delitschia confertaspora ATCC 74209]|uniref:Transcription factor, Myb superfamily n=1 Tax=Delitschia confertaspora ATCC 74209 TaxID=1513339 RepID=A0A9P4MTV3_9PLEO|nr:transcription factor, Myb superfamily [Delitschia confertaspora ATCC 74209]
MFAVENATTRPLRRTWTPKEDQILRREVQAQCNPPLFYSFSDPTPALLSGIYVLTKTVIRGEVNDWCRIATKLPGRSNKDCRKRWFNSVAGGLKKGTWTKSEDDLLRRGVEDYGHRWTLVAEVVRSRSADQCAKRWQQSLDPDLDHSEWTESEDTILADAVRKWGRHWRDIQARHFPARSKNDIKNR